MEYVADLHLHSKYSRAVSPNMVIPVIRDVAMQKGLNILAACDWTHPLWRREMREQLEEAGEGLYQLKKSTDYRPQSTAVDGRRSTVDRKEPFFMLSTEIASIYKQGDKLRRIHNLVMAPSFAVAEKISKELMKRGCNLLSDGRPIIGLHSEHLLELIMEIDATCLLIPCHVWTPHFGMYGSASGFDTIEESFGELSKYIYGIETGISSDPGMNWEVAALKTRSILSFSDAHSAPKMGREATVFQLEKPTYANVRKAIMYQSDYGLQSTDYSTKSTVHGLRTTAVDGRQKSVDRIAYTIEFYPEEGKYHFSGHRNCHVIFGPEEIREKGNTCPVCQKRLTEGVLFRVQQLADPTLLGNVQSKQNEAGLSWYTDKTGDHPPYVKLVPLLEIVAEAMSSTVASQKVKAAYEKLCNEFDSELTVLLHTPVVDITKVAGPRIGEGVSIVRSGAITIDPGYDGEYGKVSIWKREKKEKVVAPQLRLDV